jgi:hypothetical protein
MKLKNFIFHLPILALSALLLPGCQQDEPFPFSPPDPLQCPGGECTTTFQTDRKIDIEGRDENLSYEIEEGKNLVFHYRYQADDDPLISDDEYVEEIWFEIESDETEFLYQNKALKDLNALYSFSCFCIDTGPRRVVEGSIQGKQRSSDSWEISLQLTYLINQDSVTQAFSAVFEEE